MKSSAKAFAPGNISCIFKIYENPNPEKMGSLGLGFTVNKGVTVEAALTSKTEVYPAPNWCGVYFNNKKTNFPTVKSVVKKLSHGKNKKVKISISTDLPLGSGFGLSGASALATAYALNSLLSLRYSNLELAKIAHIAEVENRTGLGDVVNQYFGGFLLKLKPSSEFIVKRIPLENLPIYCKYYSKLSTKAVLSDLKIKEKINLSATEALKKIKTQKFSCLISVSKEFAQNSGLLKDKRAISTIKKIEGKGGHASMIMLGNAVFSDIPFTGSLELKISNTPAHLL